LNYVVMADYGIKHIQEGRTITKGFIEELQGILMKRTSLEGESGHLRSGQVVVGRRTDAHPDDLPIVASRFVPAPEGIYLESGVASLVRWITSESTKKLDPVLAAGMAHYQFETLHPFTDGNGRLGRYLIVLQLLSSETLSEPTLTVSPWFEARRAEYYDHLLGVSTHGDWDSYLTFFAHGIRHAAMSTQSELLRLADAQESLHEAIRNSSLRAETAHLVVDIAVANPTFTVAFVQSSLGISYGRALKVVGQLHELGVLEMVDPAAYQKRYFAPRVLEVITDARRS
jgi:Fic family protein